MNDDMCPSITDYLEIGCERCGETQKTLHAQVTPITARAELVIVCDHCGLGNRHVGHIDQSCIDPR